jgi:hypothetical protein
MWSLTQHPLGFSPLGFPVPALCHFLLLIQAAACIGAQCATQLGAGGWQWLAGAQHARSSSLLSPSISRAHLSKKGM